MFILISGKRCSGKDYCGDLLEKYLKEMVSESSTKNIKVATKSFALRLKEHFASDNGCSLERLLNDRPYKEIYRKQLIEYSKEYEDVKWVRTVYNESEEDIVIITDFRYNIEYEYINIRENLRTVKIVCKDETRISRGWVYDESIDELEGETELNSFDLWDYVIRNDTKPNRDIQIIARDIFRDFIEEL